MNTRQNAGTRSLIRESISNLTPCSFAVKWKTPVNFMDDVFIGVWIQRMRKKGQDTKHQEPLPSPHKYFKACPLSIWSKINDFGVSVHFYVFMIHLWWKYMIHRTRMKGQETKHQESLPSPHKYFKALLLALFYVWNTIKGNSILIMFFHPRLSDFVFRALWLHEKEKPRDAKKHVIPCPFEWNLLVSLNERIKQT